VQDESAAEGLAHFKSAGLMLMASAFAKDFFSARPSLRIEKGSSG
jgi:hypothetical protein